MLLHIENLTFGWQKDTLFEGINCRLEKNDIIQLIGENGTGKTTLLNLISGMIPHFNRGSMLEGDIYVNGCSMLKVSPKNLFPTIALIPCVNLELFLLTETLSQEILLTRSILKIDANQFNKQLKDFMMFFPDIPEFINLPLKELHINQKILALTFIFFLQNCRLYLFDEVLADFSESLIQQWYAFFKWLSSKGCAVIFVDHQQHAEGFLQWILKDKKLIQL